MKLKTTFLTISVALTITAVTLSSCKKDPGPAGPKGDTGAAGANGAANIKNYSVLIKPSDWIWDATYKQWAFDYPVTGDYYKAAVMAYVISGNGSEVMPYQNQVDGSITTFSTLFFVATPQITFKYYNGTTTLARPAIDKSIKLVIIPPAMIKAGADVKTYAALKNVYHLAD